MLDTDVCVAIIKADERVHARLRESVPSQLRMSAITLAELRYGQAKSTQRRQVASNLRVLLSKVAVVPFDAEAASRYGEVRAALERRGSTIGPHDLLIAAHALSLGWRLATHNLREFTRVPGLHVEDWLAAR